MKENNNTRYLLLFGTVVLLAVLNSCTRSEKSGSTGDHSSGELPNIILIMADDLGYGDVGYYDNPIVKTPNLDAMAAEAIRFDRFYSGAPVCSPTRGSCLTGRHPYRYDIPWAGRYPLPASEITLAEALKTRGYATGHFGKWHLGGLSKTINQQEFPDGPSPYSPPWKNGFDEAFPLVLWGTVLIDGYHRYAAAKANGLTSIPVINHSFDSVDDAIMYCIRTNATHRRHLTDAELFNAIREADRINKEAAKERELAGKTLRENHPRVASRIQTAKDVGVSEEKVKDVRTIENHGTEQDITDIESGKATISAKAKELKAKRANRKIAATDLRSENQCRFDVAFESLFTTLVAIKQQDWEGVAMESIKQKVWELQDIFKSTEGESYDL